MDEDQLKDGRALIITSLRKGGDEGEMMSDDMASSDGGETWGPTRRGSRKTVKVRVRCR